MHTPRHTLFLALLLSLCCTLGSATSRTLQQQEEGPAAVASAADPAAVTPQKPTCEWHPPAPKGIKMADWTAWWPHSCMATPVDKYCDANCWRGYIGWPFRPRMYCHPTPDGRADWAYPIKGDCVAYCQGRPPQVLGVSWPFNCSNGLIEGASNKPWAPPSTCTGSCRDGYIGKPAPVAKCLAPENGTDPAVWQVVQGECIDNACDGLPKRVPFANWPSNCSRLEVGSTCEATCWEGYVPEPVPVAKCIPPNETYPYASWEIAPTGVCRDNVCNGQPPWIANGNWPWNCSVNSPAVGSVCTAECSLGYVGDPIPKAVCTKPSENQTSAEWVIDVPDGCKDPTACRDDPCQDIAFAIPGSCVPTRGEQPSTPGSRQFTCSCFDYYRWDARTKTCGRASLLAFAVAKPVDITEMGARRRDARVTQIPEASWIYKYGAKKATDIGGARWIAQDKGTSEANMYAVAVADANTAWAVGSKGIIKRFANGAWSVERQPQAGASALRAVAALSSTKAWAGGVDGVALYYDGSSWRDVSIEKGRTIQAITAVVEPGGIETVWAAAGDERNANNLKGYIYKWDGQAWGTRYDVDGVTLHGITALDRYGAWACGFTSKGAPNARGVIMSWDYAGKGWARHNITVYVSGFTRFNSIVAVDYRHLYVTGYNEFADSTGMTLTGIVMSNIADFDQPPYPGWSRGSTDAVARFNAVAGLSPSTTVAVGVFKDAEADKGPDGPSPGDLGYPAVNWARYNFVDRPQKANVSIAYDLEVMGVGMKYVV